MNRRKKIKQLLTAHAKKASAKLAPRNKSTYISKADRLKLEAARSIREDFLHQNAFHETDTYTSLEKQHDMMLLVVHFYDQCVAALDKGAKVDDLIALPVREKIGRFKYTANDRVSAEYDAICAELSQQIDKAIENKEDF